jgi:hypothetical protein
MAGVGPKEKSSDGGPNGPQTGSPPPHIREAWRTWLSALGTDAEAAMAAALAYESLPPEARDAWLDALRADGVEIDVPAIALYAPLLAVESDPARRTRIESAISADRHESRDTTVAPAHALRGVGPDGTHACVLVAPVYLDFVQVLSCRYTPAGGFIAVHHDPLRHFGDVPPIRDVDGVSVEPTPLRVVVEELAHAILADKREQRQTPAALAAVAHLFAPEFDSVGQ